jgi:hypothetical protein
MALFNKHVISTPFVGHSLNGSQALYLKVAIHVLDIREIVRSGCLYVISADTMNLCKLCVVSPKVYIVM